MKDAEFSKVAKQYDTDMMAFIKRTQKAPKKVKNDTISWPEIIEMRKSLEKKALADPKNYLLDYVIISMYTYLPPSRCEYVKMKILKDKPLDPEKTNYILLKERSGLIVYSDSIAMKLPGALVKILHVWSAYNKFDYLFVKTDGTPMLKNTLSQRILSIFQRENGKKLGINSVRKAYVASVRNE